MHTAALPAAQPFHLSMAMKGVWPQPEGPMACSNAVLIMRL